MQEWPQYRCRLLPSAIAQQPSKNRSSFFFIHSANVGLATAIGDDQPFISVVLTADDLTSLGDEPTVQTIAACLLRKMLIMQSKGPYTIGGFCMGGIFAYEIARQLRAAGHDVALLVLLDAPNPSFTQSCDSVALKARYLGYGLRKAVRLGPRASFVYFCDRVRKGFARKRPKESTDSRAKEPREILQAATLAYKPGKYDGKVLLLLASEHPPHVNLRRGWEAVVSSSLHTQYVNARHEDFLKDKINPYIAKPIMFHLAAVKDDEPVASCSDTFRSE